MEFLENMLMFGVRGFYFFFVLINFLCLIEGLI